MSFSRRREYAGYRCQGHDYCSKCIYHIVLNKREGIPDFSIVAGNIGSREWPPRVDLLPAGEVIQKALSGLKRHFPFTWIIRRCIMPDHVHIALYVREATDTHLGTIIKQLKHDCSRGWAELGHEEEERLFIDNYHDTFLSGEGQLDSMLSYISDNPRRHLLRRLNPGWFRHFCITDGQHTFEAYGNWDLLVEPEREVVRISRSYSPAELVARKKCWLQTVYNDGVLVSPFISKDEKRVRDWAYTNGGAVICLTREPFGERFKPSGVSYNVCAEGRLMIVHIPVGEKLDRSACMQLNGFAERIAAGEFRLLR